jgi:hypothetical protein
VDKWWRLFNPDLVNPGRVRKSDGGGIEAVINRMKEAANFVEDIRTTFHPTQCYGSFCASSERPSYGEIVLKVADREIWDARNSTLPPVESWTLLNDDGRGTLKVQAGPRVLTLTLQPPAAPGDETVPADRSAKQIAGKLFVHGTTKGKSYEHQNSYANPDVLTSLLYSIVQITKKAKWE